MPSRLVSVLRFTLYVFLFFILAIQITPTHAGSIPAPVLKWAYAGCLPDGGAFWCDTGWYASPAVADLDGDTKAEVLWGGYELFALNGENGTIQWSGPAGNRIWPGVAVADLTGNGSLEVIVGRGGDSLTVYNSNGAVLWERNPFGSGEIRTLAVADLETDGQLEILVGRASGGSNNQVNVYEPDGTVRPGFPARRDGEDGYGWGMYNENLTVGDLNDDGYAEIIAPTDTHYITGLDRNGNQLLANAAVYVNSDHNDNGITTWAEVGVHVDHSVDVIGYADCGTEHRPNFANVAPAIADVNGDGVREIIVPGDVYNCGIGDPDGDLYYLPWIFNLDRTRWSGDGFNWTALPTPEPGSGPLSQDYSVIENIAVNTVIADLDSDGFMEILFPSYDGRLHVYWLDKTQHGNWPYDVPGSGIRFASEPIVVDLDNDGHAEVIFTSWPEKTNGVGQLHILDYLGNSLHAINLPAPSLGSSTWNGGLGAPTIANIDADADYELVIGTTHSGAVAYDLPGSENARILWGTGRGNYQRTGVAADQPAALTLIASPPSQGVEPGETVVYTFALAGTYEGTVSLTDNIPTEFAPIWSENPVTLPAEVTLTLTDPHPAGSLIPGEWFTFEITASGGENVQVLEINLLVGGVKLFLPWIGR
ncbi:MAG: VCBS repeat-containing protein [Anaerolineales bacterium]|nr:VCBS repeat-containing protein [Anaerolineales bacterium]